ncbi:MAG: protein kinase [Pseudomonadota bacterium]
MSKDSMTRFSEALGAFFARSISFATLEEAADAIAAEGERVDFALGVVDKHRAAGRLPNSLYKILTARLMGQHVAPSGHSDQTAPLTTDDTQAVEADLTTPQSTPDHTAPLGGFSEEDLTGRLSLDPTNVDHPASSPAEPVSESMTQPSDGTSVEQRLGASSSTVDEQSPTHDPTRQINRHVAPTVRIRDLTPMLDPGVTAEDAASEIKVKAEDATRPDMLRAETVPIADVPPPPSSRPAEPSTPYTPTEPLEDALHALAPTEQINPPSGAGERTLPIAETSPDDGAAFAKTQAIESGVFPSKAFPTGTGSNWHRPDQWSERHLGPLGPGSVLKNRFLIERQLGRGGMGVVFEARDKRKDEANDRDPFVAIKVLNDDFRDHPQALMALQREARKAQTLAHPNIITVYDFDRDGTTVYMTMELMRGEPMDAMLRRLKKEGEAGVEVDLARRIIKDMASGLAYAHKLDIIHSDFKPGNVFLTEDERVKILDFGIARATKYSGNTDTEQTMFDAGDLGSLTPGYAAYEMFHRAAPHPADDVYALAITAYLLFTGEHPFNRKTADEVAGLDLTPEPIRHIARHEWAAIERGLAIKREDRTQDAAQFLREFAGRRKANRFVVAAMICLSVLAGYFAVVSFQEPGPAIDFAELSPAQQTAFQEYIATGQEWLANDPPWIGGAFSEFAAAWDIHPRNPDARDGLEAVAESLIALGATAQSEDDRRRLLQDIETASSNEYLNEHRGLRRTRQALVDSLPAN